MSHPVDANLREIGQDAVWSLSTAKPGNGVEQLRDKNPETFWQSDGQQPHQVNIQFPKKVKVSQIRIYGSYKVDESYTPSCISIRIGTSLHDLQEIHVVDLKEPDGWVTIPLVKPPAPSTDPACTVRDQDYGGAVDYIRTHCVQLAILANHQNGRDTHVRQIQLFGPREDASRWDGHQIPYMTPAFQHYATIR
jgi:anaphase-promoting complex subunit 10